jgi:hypothetical protein
MERRFLAALAGAAAGIALVGETALAQEFPPFEKVTEGFTRVVSTPDKEQPLYALWVNEKTNQMLAELPRNFATQRHFIAMTISSGDMWAGLQSGDMYVYWKRFDNRLALMAPEVGTRTTGDRESKSSVSRHFTDRVVLDIPIVTMGPNGAPIIDLDDLLVANAPRFFGGGAQGNTRLATIAKAKAFPENIEVAFTMPVQNGVMKSFHYSISLIPDNTGYQPRVADERVGYFTTTYRDLGKFEDDEKWVRYVNRWHIEKADPSLKLSPPKEPIRFYIEHTVPVRYRRWVREGILYWNKAFEAVGITDAVEVYYQDEATGAYMDVDPEDVRYNFIRWLSNDVGTAIGPSRVHPLTGQILDADVVITDGWIRHFNYQFHDLLPELATESFTPETLAWLDQNPQWDPRILLAPPAQRDFMLAERERRGVLPYGGHPVAMNDPSLMGDEEYDGLVGRVSQLNGYCNAGSAKAMGMALMRMHLELGGLELLQEPEEGAEGDVIDGVPDWFVGPMLADLVAHEVGHTLGLRHNFKASSAYSMAEINSPEMKGQTTFSTSVMDYLPVNINFETGGIQGDYAMIDIGPYDFWAIEYGYTFEDPKTVLAEVADPLHQYGTDEDTGGPDPLARRYDFARDPLAYAQNQMRLVAYYRGRLLEKFVEDGESWAKTRFGYQTTLNEQMKMLSMMANWIGGAHVYRDRKGDPNGRAPIEVVDAQRQRDALNFLIANAFNDEAFGLSPELLRHMSVDKWLDDGGAVSAFEEATWPVHDRVMAMQASALTMIMNPTTLKRVYDNEFRVPADQDALTLPEVLGSVVGAVFTEFGTELNGATFTDRQPMISSLRRNLQSELTDRLVRLSLTSSGLPRAIQTLATMHLRSLDGQIDGLLEKAAGGQIDQYTTAHLQDLKSKIEQALNVQQVKGEVVQTIDIPFGF